MIYPLDKSNKQQVKPLNLFNIALFDNMQQVQWDAMQKGYNLQYSDIWDLPSFKKKQLQQVEVRNRDNQTVPSNNDHQDHRQPIEDIQRLMLLDMQRNDLMMESQRSMQLDNQKDLMRYIKASQNMNSRVERRQNEEEKRQQSKQLVIKLQKDRIERVQKLLQNKHASAKLLPNTQNLLERGDKR